MILETPKPFILPCGARAYRDRTSDMYPLRCLECMAVVGSMAMPKSCKNIMERESE